MKWDNLDLKCAERARGINERWKDHAAARAEAEKLATNAVAVLAENGPYALFLFLAARAVKSKELCQPLEKEGFGLLTEVLSPGSSQREARPEIVFPALADWSADIHRLLLMKRLLAQMLSYLRYHAKALPEKPNRGPARAAKGRP